CAAAWLDHELFGSSPPEDTPPAAPRSHWILYEDPVRSYSAHMEDLRYPIGPFKATTSSPASRRNQIKDLSGASALLRQAVRRLTDAQLDTPYRPNGWSVRQVVHHLPDSHANAYIRMRLALTEDAPTIKTY